MAVDLHGNRVPREHIARQLRRCLDCVSQTSAGLVITAHRKRVAGALVRVPATVLTPHPDVPLRVQALRWAVEQLTGEASEDITLPRAIERIHRSDLELPISTR